MIFLKKIKRVNKILLSMFVLSSLGYFVSLIFFTLSILSLSGIETLIRTILLLLFILIFVIYVFSSLVCLFTKKNKTFILISIIAILFSVIFSFGAYYIDKTYSKINKINKEELVYTSSLLTLNNTEFSNSKDFVVGMINDKSDIEGYIVAQELITNKKINKIDIKNYDTYSEMIQALYNEEINGMFTSINYTVLFTEEFPNIKSETKIIYSESKTMEKSKSYSSSKKLTEPFSILLIGVDSTSENLNANQSFNGDTLMLITFNPNTLNATVLSLPRDTYVPISCRNNTEAKINKSAYGGTKCVINTIENLVDINIDYYVKMNFKGVVALVDALGGITVDIPKDLCEQNSNREFGDKEICLKKGIQKLNGEEALAFSRNRHAFLRGDFDRVKNQQAVVEAMMKSAKNLNSIGDVYEILDAVSNNMDTNMTTKQMLSFYEVGKDILSKILKGDEDFITIEKTELTGYDLTINNSYTFQYYKESLEQISNLMKVNLEIEKPTIIKTFNFSANTPYEQEIVGTNINNKEERRNTIPNFVGLTKSSVNTWNSYGINVIYIDVTEKDKLFDETIDNDTIVDQSIKYGSLVDNIKDLIIYVIKK